MVKKKRLKPLLLQRDLCNREFQSVSKNQSWYSISMTKKEADEARYALVKALYKSLFQWLIQRLNKQMDRNSSTGQNFIGILDIFGFEIFENNSLEQLLINYANEVITKFLNFIKIVF